MAKKTIDGWCCGEYLKHTGKEVRNYRPGYGAVCRSCYKVEVERLRLRNQRVIIGPKLEFPKWKALRVYHSIAKPKYPTTKRVFIAAFCLAIHDERLRRFPDFMLTEENLAASAKGDAKRADAFWNIHKDVYKRYDPKNLPVMLQYEKKWEVTLTQA